MATIQARKRGKSTYYYLVESRRVDGKPRPIVLQYLGTAESLEARLREADQRAEPVRADVNEFGAVAALWDLAKSLLLIEEIDQHAQKRHQGVSIGQYIVLAAINRCVATTSKSRLGQWYAKTTLPRLCPIAHSLLAGQRFWDAMKGITPQVMAAVEANLSRRIVHDFELDLRTLCFDCTNFDTYIDSSNPAELPQRGHAKSKRVDLRIVGLALMVSADGTIPLFSETYAGNQPDPVTFQSITDQLAARYRELTEEAQDITLVFDKGNNSHTNLKSVAAGPYHVIGSLVPSQHKDLMAVPLEEFSKLDHPNLEGTCAYRTQKVVFGRQWTIVVTRNQNLIDAQLRGIAQHIGKRRKQFEELRCKLQNSQRPEKKGRGKKFTRQGLLKHAAALTKGQYVKDILQVDVIDKDGTLDLCFRQSDSALQRLIETVLGKHILFTDNHHWTTEEIVLGYRSQQYVESAFRQMKDRYYVSMEPIRHWTDHQIRVHVFICVLALSLSHLLRRKIQRQGLELSVDTLLEQLSQIQEIVNIFPVEGSKGGRPKARRVLSTMTPLQTQLFNMLELDRYHSK